MNRHVFSMGDIRPSTPVTKCVSVEGPTLSVRSASFADNRQQEAIIAVNEGAVVVNAGAGSGKTHVLSERVARLVRDGVTSPGRILVLTFTVKAAREFTERIQGRIGATMPWACNFHRFCGRILRDYGIARDGHFTVMAEKESSNLIVSSFCEAIGASRDRGEALLGSIRSAVAARRMALFCDDAPPSYGRDIDDAADGYEARLAALGAYDFDGMIFAVADRLKRDDALRERVVGLWDFVLVDELQDTNHIQFELLKLIAPHRNIMGVGDMDQGIYAFRGAIPSHMYEFVHTFDASILPLELNYRSKREILLLANAVIACNEDRMPKTLLDTRSNGGVADLRIHDDEGAEADYVAQAIRSDLRRGIPLDRVAVLARSHRQCEATKAALTSCGIPHAELTETSNPWDHGIALAMVSLVEVMAGDASAASWARASILTGVTHDTFLPKQGMPCEGDPEDCMKAIAVSNPKVADFMMALESARRTFRCYGNVSDAVGRMLALSGFKDWCIGSGATSRCVQERKSRLNTFLQVAEGYHSLTAFAEDASSGALADLQGGEKVVVVGTVHGAKGLEWDTVHLVGCHDDAMPHRASHAHPEFLEEECRLVHVAMTRARENLHLHSPRTVIGLDGGMECKRVSRFILRACESFPIPVYNGTSGLAIGPGQALV